MEKFLTIAIVQARMGSTRLPGKVMKKVLGKPLIGYLFENLGRSQKIDKIVLATSTNKKNDILCRYVESLGYDIFRGSEEDVLSRYYNAVLKYKTKNIVRITGDCPLIDPVVCDNLINFYFKKKLDYAYLSPRYAEGLDCEIISFDTLEISHQKATKKSEREHVTLFVRNNLDRFKAKMMDNKIDESKYRITVDEPEDFEVIKNIIENLNISKSKYYSFGKIKKYLDKNPEIFQKNSKIIRNEGLSKSLEKENDI